MTIVRLQAAENLDWLEACLRATQLVDSNSEAFKKAVKREVQREYNRKFMAQLNKVKNKWEEGYKVEHFTAPCSICGKPIEFSQRENNWESQIKPTLHNAFRGWRHTTCAR